MAVEKRRSFLINFAYYGVIFMLTFVAIKYGFAILAPFAIAFVLAFLLKRLISYIVARFDLAWKPVALLTVLVFYCTVGLLITLLSAKAITGITSLVQSIPMIYEKHVLPFFMGVFNNIEDNLAAMDPSLVTALNELGNQAFKSMGQMVSNISVWAMGAASSFASSLPGLFIQIVVMIISTFFITADYEKLTGFCMRQLSEGSKELFLQIKEYVGGTLLVCIRSYLLIMSITFVELSICLSIIGISHSVLVAFCISIFDILPVLGTGGIMIPWTVLTVIQGNYMRALGLLITYVVITVIRNILEPKIVGGQLGLHPVVTLASMFLGAEFFGVLGIFGFPIGLSLLRHLDDHGVINIFRKENDSE